MSDVTRASLLERVRDPRDDRAWAEFHGLYAPLLEGYARAQGLSPGNALDVRDQCMAVLARKMPTFEYRAPAARGGSGKGAGRGGFKAWLFKLARDKVVDHLRRPRPRHAETAELGSLADRAPTPEEVWEERWRARHLAWCLERVRERESERTWRAFELLFEGTSVEDVGAELGMNANQVYKAKSRVLKLVRETYERIGSGAALPAELDG